jgi:glycosyltransferase involved in cell wall biosynthesis
MSLPKVSILIPCYNAEQWIGQAIESALRQTYLNKEVIVVDDGSTDKSLAIIQSFDDAIAWEAGPNRGGNIARNRLLELSTGEWLQYLDADDYLLPDKIEHQVQFLSQNATVDVVYSPSRFEYWQGISSFQEVLSIPEPHDPWSLLARWYLPQTGSPLWRKQAIIDVGGWKQDQPCCQEHELYLRLLMAGKHFAYFPEAGSIYRQWSETTVCKRDLGEVWRQRLAIEQRLETYLKNANLLTPERQHAINQARFECARKIWSCDRTWASQILQIIHQGDAQFCPSGDAAPRFYRLVYRLFGFNIAEQIAAMKRQLTYSFAPKGV